MKFRVTTIAAVLLTISTAAYADSGDHNGNGNTGLLNGNLNGSLSGNNVASRSRSTATSNYNGYQGIDNAGNSSNSNTFKERLQAPGIAAPGLTSGANTCAGSWGVGLSGPGAGFSFGNTYSMRQCEARVLADQAYRYGLKRVAVQVLYDEHPMFRRAMDIQRQAVAPRQKR